MQQTYGFKNFHIVPQTFVLPSEYQEFCSETPPIYRSFRFLFIFTTEYLLFNISFFFPPQSQIVLPKTAARGS